MSKMTNLKKGVVGVCAATMLAGMCAVPAFAVVPDVTPGSNETVASGSAAAAKTEISAKTDAAQISATVPTAVVASVDAAGALTLPDSTAFVSTVGNDSWPVKVSALDVAVENSGALQTSEAGVDAADKLYLAIGGKHLTASGNGDAIASLAQTTAGTADIGIAMTGKMYNPTYSAATTGLKLATLTWTLAAV